MLLFRPSGGGRGMWIGPSGGANSGFAGFEADSEGGSSQD